MKYLLFFTGVFFLFAGCERKTSSLDALYKEVMVVHDEVMPWMSDIMRYKKQIREKVDSTADGEATELKALMNQLDAADKAMMDWMRNFSRNDYKVMSEEEASAYLQDQKQKIEEVRKTMREALDKAKKAI